MFNITRTILSYPLRILAYIGQPFKYESDTSLRNFSDSQIKNRFNYAKQMHYEGKIFAALGLVIGCMATFLLLVLAPGVIIPVIVLLVSVSLLVDGLMMVARQVYAAEAQKQAGTGTELALTDLLNDTTLESLFELKRKAEEEFKQNHGGVRINVK